MVSAPTQEQRYWYRLLPNKKNQPDQYASFTAPRKRLPAVTRCFISDE